MQAQRSETLATPAEERVAARCRVSIRANVREAGSTRIDIDVVDLSATGFRFESVYGFAIGARVFLSLPTLSPLEAVVAWRNRSSFGCRFVRPLYPSVFDMIAARFG
jgi:PilZ domain